MAMLGIAQGAAFSFSSFIFFLSLHSFLGAQSCSWCQIFPWESSTSQGMHTNYSQNLGWGRLENWEGTSGIPRGTHSLGIADFWGALEVMATNFVWFLFNFGCWEMLSSAFPQFLFSNGEIYPALTPREEFQWQPQCFCPPVPSQKWEFWEPGGAERLFPN